MARTIAPRPTPKKPTAFDLKLALMEYFRFERQWICVDECLLADIVADSGKHIIEVEVKIDKYDLLKGEEKSRHKINKHRNYKEQWWKYNLPNKYYFCVPTELGNTAMEYAYKLNPKYGVITYDPAFSKLLIIKSARMLHEEYSKKHSHQIAKRCSAKIITLMQKQRKQK